MITDRDKRIIRHMEMYKYATLEQIQKIFFKEQVNSYNIARRRMAAIKNAGYLKVDRDISINRLVYWYDDKGIKMPSRHRLLVLDVLANLHYMGCEVQMFQIEKEWMDGKVRSDAFTVFTLGNNRLHYFIEVSTSNNDYNLKKYDKLLSTDEVQNFLGRNVIPRVLLITDRSSDSNIMHLKKTQVIMLNSRLHNFSAIILPPSAVNEALG